MARTKKKKDPKATGKRTYESQVPALQSLRLIAAPRPEDDLSDDELAAICKDPRQSPELIGYLIEFVKSL